MTVSNTDWGTAQLFFSKNPYAVKLPRARANTDAMIVSDNQDNHSGQYESKVECKMQSENTSFIYIPSLVTEKPENRAFAIGPLLGEGAWGKVKMLHNKTGKELALKIEARGARAPDDPTKQVMEKLGYLIAELERELPKETEFKGAKTTKKLYTVMKLRKGKNLEAIIKDMQWDMVTNGNYLYRLEIALQSAKAIRKLHLKQCVHGDVKPANLIMGESASVRKVKAVDFGNAFLMPEDQEHVYYSGGTLGYMAPEIEKDLISSYSIDIYALGQIFIYNLNLSKSKIPLLFDMVCYFSVGRPTIDSVIDVLQAVYDKQLSIKNALTSKLLTCEDIQNILSQNKDIDITELFQLAIEYGALDNVKLIVKHNPRFKHIYMHDGEQVTPLMIAAQKGHLDLVEYFICECQMKKLDKSGRNNNAIQIALEHKQFAVFKYLVQDLDPQSELAKELLLFAIKLGYFDMVQFLVEQKEISASHVLKRTLKEHPKKVEILQYLISKCPVDTIAKYTIESFTSLLKANVLEIVKILSPLLNTNTRQDACVEVAIHGHLSALRYLMGATDCNREVQNRNNVFLLKTALGYKQPQIVGYLLENHIEISMIQDLAKHENSKSLVHDIYFLAVEQGYSVLVENIGEAFSKETAYLKAAECGQLALVTFFLGKNVDIDYQDPDTGQTALIAAAESGHASVVLYLVDKKANERLVNTEHHTAFYCGVKNNHVEVVKILVGSMDDVRKHIALRFALDREYDDVAWCIIFSGLSFAKSILDAGLNNQNPQLSFKLAIKTGNIAIAQHMLNQGFSLNIAKHPYQSTLALAVQHRQTAMLNWILDNDPYNEQVEEALALAVQYGHEAMMDILLDFQRKKGIEPKPFDLLKAAIRGDKLVLFNKMFQWVQEAGIDINSLIPTHEMADIYVPVSIQSNILGYAIASFRYRMVVALINAQVEINDNILLIAISDRRSCIELFYALDRNDLNIKISKSPEVAKKLLKTAVCNNAGDVAVFLLAHPELFPVSLEDKCYILRLAIQKKYFDMTRLLIGSGVPVNGNMGFLIKQNFTGEHKEYILQMEQCSDASIAIANNESTIVRIRLGTS